MSEQLDLNLCNMVSRGMSLKEARVALNVPEPSTEEIVVTEEVAEESTEEAPLPETTEESVEEEQETPAPKRKKKR